MKDASTSALIVTLIVAIFSSSILLEVIKAKLHKSQNDLNKAKTALENENVIISMYDKILDDMRAELARLKSEISELRQRENTYNENQNLWIKSQNELQHKIAHLERENKTQSDEIKRLNNIITELKSK